MSPRITDQARTELVPAPDRAMLIMQYGMALTAVLAALLLTILR